MNEVYIAVMNLCRNETHDPDNREYLFPEEETLGVFDSRDKAEAFLKGLFDALHIEVKWPTGVWRLIKIVKDNGTKNEYGKTEYDDYVCGMYETYDKDQDEVGFAIDKYEINVPRHPYP